MPGRLSEPWKKNDEVDNRRCTEGPDLGAKDRSYIPHLEEHGIIHIIIIIIIVIAGSMGPAIYLRLLCSASICARMVSVPPPPFLGIAERPIRSY